jgi:hypothetical protein
MAYFPSRFWINNKFLEMSTISFNNFCPASWTRHKVVKARQVFFGFDVRKLGHSGEEVARYLGMSTSCVNQFTSLEKNPDADLNIHA